jgi:hypothetical protein
MTDKHHVAVKAKPCLVASSVTEHLTACLVAGSSMPRARILRTLYPKVHWRETPMLSYNAQGEVSITWKVLNSHWGGSYSCVVTRSACVEGGHETLDQRALSWPGVAHTKGAGAIL